MGRLLDSKPPTGEVRDLEEDSNQSPEQEEGGMQKFSESWVGNILLRNMDLDKEGGGRGLNNNNEDFPFKGKVVSIKRMKQKKLIAKKPWKSWKKLVMAGKNINHATQLLVFHISRRDYQ